MVADDEEATPAAHAEEAPAKLQLISAKIFHIAATACNSVARGALNSTLECILPLDIKFDASQTDPRITETL